MEATEFVWSSHILHTPVQVSLSLVLGSSGYTRGVVTVHVGSHTRFRVHTHLAHTCAGHFHRSLRALFLRAHTHPAHTCAGHSQGSRFTVVHKSTHCSHLVHTLFFSGSGVRCSVVLPPFTILLRVVYEVLSGEIGRHPSLYTLPSCLVARELSGLLCVFSRPSQFPRSTCRSGVNPCTPFSRNIQS